MARVNIDCMCKYVCSLSKFGGAFSILDSTAACSTKPVDEVTAPLLFGASGTCSRIDNSGGHHHPHLLFHRILCPPPTSISSSDNWRSISWSKYMLDQTSDVARSMCACESKSKYVDMGRTKHLYIYSKDSMSSSLGI